MSQTILDQDLEKTPGKSEYHNLVKGFLKVFFAYHVYTLGQYIYMLVDNDLIYLLSEFSNFSVGVFALIKMLGIYRIFKYKRRGFYSFLLITIFQILLLFIRLYALVPEWKTILIINTAWVAMEIGILWAFLQIKNDNIKAWDLLK